MKSLNTLALATFTLALISCNGDSKTEAVTEKTSVTDSVQNTELVTGEYDPTRGLGPHENVDVSTFNPEMAAMGKRIAEVKCTSCHKPTEEKLVGPGWRGVTHRQTPEWIMNFITNPDPMIDVDPQLQKQLELCLVRMPNQGLDDTEARQILEYMREIDGVR